MGKKLREQVRIEDIGSKGKGLARVNEKVLFVRDTLPGDLVDVKLTKKRKNFEEGLPLRFHEHSERKQEAFCEHFDLCGGCTWQNLPYEDQLHYKEKAVRDQLERIGKVDTRKMEPIMPSPSTTYYRNKLEFSCTSKRWLRDEEVRSGENIEEREGLGLHIPGRFDKVVDITHCHLQPEPSNSIRNAARRIARKQCMSFYDPVTHEGFFRTLLIRTTSTGQSMVAAVFAGKDREAIGNFLEALRTEQPEVDSWYLFINKKKNDSLHDQKAIHYSGAEYIEEDLNGRRFRIGPKSFFQTNSEQAAQLYEKVREFAGLTGKEKVADLYTGTGSIAIYLADQAEKVIGIESVEEAVRDAKANAELNGVGNTEFRVGDLKDAIGDMERPDVLVTDPPRAGMHQDVVKRILELAPDRMVYVSCDPGTQARDLEMLQERYGVTAIQPVDMFPHTYHVENVVRLELKG